MEEDIKVLEEKLKQWEPYKNIKFKTRIEKEIARENQAIENVLERYKELEENSISKDKIREKLDYQYELWNTPNKQKEYSRDIVNILEELLEED